MATTILDTKMEIGEVKNKIPDVSDLVKKKKQIITLRFQKLRKYILILLITINICKRKT